MFVSRSNLYEVDSLKIRCYQEYLSKGLTEKYGNLNTDKEKLINSANAEISSLQSKLAGESSDSSQYFNQVGSNFNT